MGNNVLGDKAYGAEKIRNHITKHGATYTIPPQSNISNPWDCDWSLYKERHLVECFFQKLKWFRRIATRYDKSDDSFLAFVYLASIAILVK
jgi:transposase